MKTWALGALMGSTFALMACGNSTATGGGVGGTSTGTGGHTTVSASHSGSGTSTSVASSGGGGMAAGTCAMPGSAADCVPGCTDRTSCFMCESAVHMPGVKLYNTLVDCVFCTACYTDCQLAMQPMMGGCMGAPAMKDACDTGTPGMMGCSACQMCSTKATGTCNAAITACVGNADCKALLKELPTCPK